MSDDNLFRELGAAMYGPQWQSPLARHLDVNLRTVQRWAAGEVEPPEAVMNILVSDFLDWVEIIDALAKRVRR